MPSVHHMQCYQNDDEVGQQRHTSSFIPLDNTVTTIHSSGIWKYLKLVLVPRPLLCDTSVTTAGQVTANCCTCAGADSAQLCKLSILCTRACWRSATVPAAEWVAPSLTVHLQPYRRVTLVKQFQQSKQSTNIIVH